MNENVVSDFELIQGKLQGLYDEVLTLTKKSPNDLFNKFKLKLTNGVLAAANGLLRQQKLPIPIDGFEQFDEDSLPSNSDAVLVLSQYLQCLEKFRAENIVKQFDYWYWVIDGQRSGRRTAPPRRIA